MQNCFEHSNETCFGYNLVTDRRTLNMHFTIIPNYDQLSYGIPYSSVSVSFWLLLWDQHLILVQTWFTWRIWGRADGSLAKSKYHHGHLGDILGHFLLFFRLFQLQLHKFSRWLKILNWKAHILRFSKDFLQILLKMCAFYTIEKQIKSATFFWK